MTADVDIQLPPPSNPSPSPSASPANLKGVVYIPSTAGPLPEPTAASLVSLIDNAFSFLYSDIPGGLGMFPASSTRLPGGMTQLYNEVGKGWLFVWTLDDVPVGTATIRTVGRGWTRVPTYEEAHADPLLDVPKNCQSYVLTEQAKVLLGKLEQEAGSMALYELSSVAVDPKLKGAGIGSAMLRAVEEFVRAIDVSKGNFWVGREEKFGGAEKKMLVIHVIDKTGSETWYGKRGYEHVATAHKGCGFWDCRLKEGFDQLTMFKEL